MIHNGKRIRAFSIVIILEEGRVFMSRDGGTDLETAQFKAEQRRQDFPHADEIRVVENGVGVISQH